MNNNYFRHLKITESERERKINQRISKIVKNQHLILKFFFLMLSCGQNYNLYLNEVQFFTTTWLWASIVA
jgi:hypothetical protein